MPTIFERIQAADQGRNPLLLKMRYAMMGLDAFSFYRGSCGLFYQDWPAENPLNQAPTVYVCGDLHLANFGTYKGDNRLVYFDVNDFDQAMLAPATWDLARLLTSVWLASAALPLEETRTAQLCQLLLDSYTAALVNGKAHSVEAATATGMVKQLMKSLAKRNRRDFLNSRTVRTGRTGERQLLLKNRPLEELKKQEKEAVATLLGQWAATTEAHPLLVGSPRFFRVLDIARRPAGLGSLGVERYVILVEGLGSPDRNYLLDLKQARDTDLQPFLGHIPQPQWDTPAQRCVAIQRRYQGTSPALLSALTGPGGKSYVLRELQPTQDKIDLTAWGGRYRRLEKLMVSLGQIVAWNQLRSGGRQGSAITDSLIEFAANRAQWEPALRDYARRYAKQVGQDYQQFCQELKAARLVG